MPCPVNRMVTNKRRNTPAVSSRLRLLDKYTVTVVSPSPWLQWVVTLCVSQCTIRERLLRLELARETERIQLLRKVCHWAHCLTATVWSSTKSNTNSREKTQSSRPQFLVDHFQPYLWEIHLTWITLVAFQYEYFSNRFVRNFAKVPRCDDFSVAYILDVCHTEGNALITPSN